MQAALVILDDISAKELRRTARLEANGRVICHLLAIANALDGMSRERAGAAEQAGIDRQSLRDWMVRFNADPADTARVSSWQIVLIKSDGTLTGGLR